MEMFENDELKFSWNFDDFRSFDSNGSRRRKLQGGNQVDGLPPARHCSAGQKGRLHAHAPDHEKVVSEGHCILEVLGNYNNSCEEHIEVYRNGIKVWKWRWNFRVLSILNFSKKSEIGDIFWKFQIFWKMLAGGAPALRVYRAVTRLTVHRSLS